MAPRETEDNAYAKLRVDKERAYYRMLWYLLWWSVKHYFIKKLQIRPMERNPRQSWILDSTSWSPDSRYCISVFVSGTMSHLWLGGA